MANLEELMKQYENDPEIRKEIDKILEDGKITPREFLTFAAKHDVKVTLADLPDIAREAKNLIPDADEAKQKIADAREHRKEVVEKVASGVSDAFDRSEPEVKQFYINDDCVGCGECASSCPMDTITIVDERPVWGTMCIHCMTCVDHCPVGAITYGIKES